MDSLPPELLHQILMYLPAPSRPSTRLTSRQFNAILAPRPFKTLPSFLDPNVADAQNESAVRRARRRGVTSVWSPRCSVPRNLPIPQSFLLALYLALRGRSWHRTYSKTERARSWDADSAISGVGEDDGEECATPDTPDKEEMLTVGNMKDVLGREDLNEEVLRAAMFRYALYLSYLREGQEEAPSLWVFDTKTWGLKE
ncbi:hypothetical protein QQS21_008763 [Conoideocrella luteorostrata]|uniref:F-box domain-containing protein n=1 Tax=Conoideocrella luteorostrata TaxID=1105319 RepID=A0AAJ0CI87_9HYPO|nr:hypothetical protein QQS21_008763 [Conoideocrella luteorostrata]